VKPCWWTDLSRGRSSLGVSFLLESSREQQLAAVLAYPTFGPGGPTAGSPRAGRSVTGTTTTPLHTVPSALHTRRLSPSGSLTSSGSFRSPSYANRCVRRT